MEFYPALAQLPCATCQQFHVEYDWQTHTGSGRVKMIGRPGDGDSAGNLRPMTKPANTLPPCKVADGPGCPKGSPEQEQDHVLSERNWRALKYYRMVKATGGRAMSDAAAADEIVQRNFTIIDPIMRAAEQRDLARMIAGQLPTVAIPVVAKKR